MKFSPVTNEISVLKLVASNIGMEYETVLTNSLAQFNVLRVGAVDASVADENNVLSFETD